MLRDDATLCAAPFEGLRMKEFVAFRAEASSW